MMSQSRGLGLLEVGVRGHDGLTVLGGDVCHSFQHRLRSAGVEDEVIGGDRIVGV